MNRNLRALMAGIVALAVVTAGVGGAGVAGADAGATQDDCEFPVTVTDATGTEVTVEEEPEEVVVTAQSEAQVLWELDQQEKVTGMPVDQFSAYLEGHDERTDVLTEDRQNIDVEQVVDLDPDLVIAAGINDPEQIQQLRDSGLTVYQHGSAGSIQDVKDKTLTTGELVGACDQAQATVDWMDERLSVVEETVEGEDSPSMLYWLGDGYTAGNGTFQHELIEAAGAENAAANMGVEGWGVAGDEDIVNEDPEYLLLQEGWEVPDNEAVQSTTAVEEGNVVRVNANYFNQAGPRVVLAVEQIAEQLHPEAYEEATAEDGPENETDGTSDESGDGAGDDEENATDDETSAGGDEEATEEDADGVPGFGVPAAVAALIAALAAIGRRT